MISSLLVLPYIASTLLPYTTTANTTFTYHNIDNKQHSYSPYKSIVIQEKTLLKQLPSTSIFTDIRTKLDLSTETNKHELNLGLAYRQNFHHNYVSLGTYVFWDVSHVKDQVFAQQNTCGFELYTKESYLSTNFYIPYSNFTTDISYFDETKYSRDWRLTQQEGLTKDVQTLPGMDINFSKTYTLSPRQRVGLDILYNHFSTSNHVEKGPSLGLSLTNINTHNESTYKILGSYDNFHKTSLGVRTQIQWNTHPLHYPNEHGNNIPPIVRDIDIRTTPIDQRPFVKVKAVQGNYPNFGRLTNSVIREYLSNNFKIIEIDDDRPSDVLVLGPVWLWTRDRKQIQEQLELVKKDPAKIKIFYAGEAENSTPTDEILDVVDLMISSAISKKTKHHRYNWGYYYGWGRFITLSETPDRELSPYRKNGCEPAKKEHFTCFLTTNGKTSYPGVQDRIALFDNLSKYKFIASPGKVRSNMPPIPKSDKETQKFYSSCKFVIAYENQKEPGYITEKPYRAWLSGSIPIYDAHASVKDDINLNAVVFASHFNDQQKLIDEIKYLDQNDEAYCKKWHENIINHPSQEWKDVHDKLYEHIDDLFVEKIFIGKALNL